MEEVTLTTAPQELSLLKIKTLLRVDIMMFPHRTNPSILINTVGFKARRYDLATNSAKYECIHTIYYTL